MDHEYYDLFVDSGVSQDGLVFAGRLGWSGICVAKALDQPKSFSCGIDAVRASGIAVYAGARISAGRPDVVQKEARSALEQGADLVLVEGGSEDINRAASECWEVDVLLHPERGVSRDLPDQKCSGMDHVTARFMAEKGIALCIDLSGLLNSYGMGRSQLMGRMRQNVKLARKYGTPIVLASGASDRYGMRSPRDLYSVGISLGMDPGLAKKALTDYPALIVKKARDRKDPNVLTKGLEVVSGGAAEKPGRKKLSGWY